MDDQWEHDRVRNLNHLYSLACSLLVFTVSKKWKKQHYRLRHNPPLTTVRTMGRTVPVLRVLLIRTYFFTGLESLEWMKELLDTDFTVQRKKKVQK